MKAKDRAFSLVELLVATGVIALLVGVLVPALSGGRRTAQATVCGSNLRELATVNMAYAAENGDGFVPAGTDIWDTGGGRFRWHGARDSAIPGGGSTRFKSARGPLARYLGEGGEIKECPARVAFGDGVDAYEIGAGGYGYNQHYVGSRYWSDGYFFQSPGAVRGTLTTEVRDPAGKVMFADAAMPQVNGGGPHYTEESFCYPPHFLSTDGRAEPGWGLATPDTHFRHLGRAQVAWCDGHVEGRPMDFTLDGTNVYGADSGAAGIGWFGPRANSLFDAPGRG